jgi:hypothetical protein
MAKTSAPAISSFFAAFRASIKIASLHPMIDGTAKRVLIYDEAGFSRICSALLEMSGCAADVVGEEAEKLDQTDVGLFVTSYPYGAFMLEEVQKRSIPTIVLFDDLDDRFVGMLHAYDNIYFMLKPLNYDKFRRIVHQLLGGGTVSQDDASVL